MFRRIFIGLSSVCLLSGVAMAQTTEDEAARTTEPLEIGQSGEAYLKAVGRRIDTEVAYFDPTRPAPKLETDRTPPATLSERESVTPSETAAVIVAGVVLAAVLFAFFRFGSGISVSLRAQSANPERAAQARAAMEIASREPKDLREILNMPDRRKAIVALAQSTLSRVISANSLLAQRSWTARDALRRIPRDQAHLGDVRDLVFAAERVQFGDREISQSEFEAHVERVRPIFLRRNP